MSLRIAVVNQHPEDVIGGSELQADLFARELTARGHEVTFIAMRSRRADPPPATPYRLVRLAPEESADPQRVAAAVRATGADVVYWRMNRIGLDGVARELARGPHRVPVVLAIAHVDDVARWPTGPLSATGPRGRAAELRHRLAHRRSWRAFRHVAAVAAQRRDFLGRAPVALQRHVPNVVDPRTGPFARPRPYVAWVANLKPRKRPELLVPIAQALAPHGIDLVVVGAVQDPRYAHLAAPLDEAPTLHALGPLPPHAAAGVIAGARALAVTFRPEGLSNALLQAWWHGVPTVSLDYDPDGLIASASLGAVCDGEVERFLAALVRHATDDTVRSEAGARAAALARERFAVDANVTALEELLHATVRASVDASGRTS